MSGKIILLLGGNKLNRGIVQKFRNKGYRVYVIDWNEHPQLIGDRHYRIDVKDPAAIMSALKNDGEWKDTVFAYSSIDLAVPSVAAINREIGLRTISQGGLKFSSSKSMMTKRWNERGLLNRISRHYQAFSDEITELNARYKLIIKPDNSASSRGITILDRNADPEELVKAFDKAKTEATDDIVVVEEFVEGIEHTVEMIGDSYGNVCVYAVSQKTHTKNTRNNRIAVKLHYNSETPELQEKIAAAGIACYKALEFSASLGHLEVILKPDGSISPVEIGARSSGFIASDLVDIVSGASFLEDLMEVHNGARVTNGLHRQTDRSSMYFFYDFPGNSIVRKECNLLDYCSAEITSRYSDRSSIAAGREFSLIDNDNARLGYEVLEGPRELMTPEYIADAERRMLNDMLEIIK